MLSLLRITLDNSGRFKSFFGYVAIRKQPQSYLITFKFPHAEHESVRADTQEQAVKVLYAAFLGFLHRQMKDVADKLAVLPLRETHRNGFRKGWLQREKQRLVLENKEVTDYCKRTIESVVCRLKEKGWPTPPLPPLPWEKFDVKTAATSARIGRVYPVPIQPAADGHQTDLQDLKHRLPVYTAGPEETQRTHSWMRLLANLRPPSRVQTDGRPLPVSLSRTEGGQTPRSPGEEIRDQP